MIKIGIAGASGRMGKALLHEASNTDGFVLSGVLTRTPEQLPPLPDGIKICHDIASLIASCDVVIDFTAPEITLVIAKAMHGGEAAHVVGTTGFTDAQHTEMRDLSRNSRMFVAPNMSMGVNILLQLTEQAAALLDESFDIDIYELHHRHKKDAPSGTALALGKAAAAGRKVDLNDKMKLDRTGERMAGDIGFAISRAGETVGDHSVTFAGPGERIELWHKASDRAIYARGAMKAAGWLIKQPSGFYGFKDLLKA